MDRALSLVFMTQDERLYLPRLFETVLAALHSEVAGIVILKPILARRSFAQTVYRHWCLYGTWDFLTFGCQFAVYGFLAKLKRRLPSMRNFSVRNVAEQFGIPVIQPADVNSHDVVTWIAGCKPDLIVSISAPQILKAPLLQLPRLGCINLHGGRLPSYRGLMPSFWVLANGEQEAVSTVHRMTERVDDGEILAQVPVPIFPHDSLDALIRRSKSIGARSVLEVIERLRTGDVPGIQAREEGGTYYGFPTRADRRRFLGLGHRFR